MPIMLPILGYKPPLCDRDRLFSTMLRCPIWVGRNLIVYTDIVCLLMKLFCFQLQGVDAAWWPSEHGYKWACQPVDMADNANTRRVSSLLNTIK